MEELDDEVINDAVNEGEDEDENENDDELDAMTANEPDLDANTVNNTLLRRIVRNLIKGDDEDDSRKKAYTQATTENLAKLCDMLHIDYTDLDLGRPRVSKRIIFDRLISFVCHVRESFDDTNACFRSTLPKTGIFCRFLRQSPTKSLPHE